MRTPALVIMSCLPFLVGCAPSEPEGPPPPRPIAEVVREIGAAMRLASEMRADAVAGGGGRAVWRPRMDTNLQWLDQLADALEPRGAFGAPDHERADELQRIAWEVRQTAEGDADLVKALRLHVIALEREAKRLRTFQLPPAAQPASQP